MKSERPKVSVCVVTYNQSRFIAQCLQSLVSQETNFLYEIIVSDDASIDGTQEVIADFKTKYPSLFRVAFQKRNKGPTRNYVFAYRIARGDYIIHMDGDDYALPGKFQSLFDVLEARPDVNVAWHRMMVMSPDGRLRPDKIKSWLRPRGEFTRSDVLALGTVGAHSAKICRTAQRIRVGRPSGEIMDYFATIEHIADGRGVWVDEIIGVYREGVGISSSSRIRYAKMLIEHLSYFLSKDESMRASINSHALWLAIRDLLRGQNLGAFDLWRKTFTWMGCVKFLYYSPYYIISRI
jgi:glycosyltransferase involved in cell wall biosynthesis